MPGAGSRRLFRICHHCKLRNCRNTIRAIGSRTGQMLNPEVEPEEPDINPSNPPPAILKPNQMQLSRRNSTTYYQAGSISSKHCKRGRQSAGNRARFCIEKMESFTAFVSASLAWCYQIAPIPSYQSHLLLCQLAGGLLCCLPQSSYRTGRLLRASPTDLSPLTVLPIRTP